MVGNPELTWSAAVAACFIGGAVEFSGGFIGPWMKRNIPRAALLGTVAGIGFIWMATQGLFDIFSDPVVGFPIFIVAMVGLFGGYLFPKKLPPLVVAVVGGIIYAFCLGRTSIDFTGIGFYFPNPVSTFQNLVNGFSIVAPYLTIIIPIEIYNFVETMDNVEAANAAGDNYSVRTFQNLVNGFSIVAPYLTIIIPIEIYNFVETMDNVEAANAAGDNYSVREAQFADGICTMISALFGGVVPNTVWLGHAGLKKADAGIGYSIISGLILGGAGIFGLFTFLSELVPPAICGITYLWCAVIMVAQAFRVCEGKYFAAITVSMIPPVADFLFTQVTGSVGLANIWTEVTASGVNGYSPEVTEMIINAGVMWRGIPEVKAGAIIVGILAGAIWTEVTASGVNGYSPEVTEMIINAGVMWRGIPEVKAGAIIVGILAGAMTAFIIERKLDKAAITMFVAAVLSLFGFVHSASLGFYPHSQFVLGYLVSTVLLFVLHFGSKSWLEAQDDFDYV